MLSLADDSTITIVAWWGATVATIVLVWDIFKWWKSGADVSLNVQPDQLIYDDSGVRAGRWVSVEAANNGDRATTLTNMTVAHYKSWFYCLLRRKPKSQGFVKGPGVLHKFPYTLEPGTTWLGLFRQTDELTELFRSSASYCKLLTSSHKRPVIARIKCRDLSHDQPNESNTDG